MAKKPKRIKKPVTDLGKTVPSNLKFAVIISVTLFWVSFFRSFVHDVMLVSIGDWAVDLVVAVVASMAGYVLLVMYRKIICRLRKVRV